MDNGTILRLDLLCRPYMTGLPKVPMQDPCPFGPPVLLTLAHVASLNACKTMGPFCHI